MSSWATNLMRTFSWGGKPDKDEDAADQDGPEPKPATPPRRPAVPRQAAQAPAAGPAPAYGSGPTMFQEHAAMIGDMYRSTQNAWNAELKSRVSQVRDAQEREHEYNLELLRQQGATARAQMGSQGASAGPWGDPQRQARNRGLASAAGFGGYTLHSDGRGNTEFAPHAFGFNPIARSLLG